MRRLFSSFRALPLVLATGLLSLGATGCGDGPGAETAGRTPMAEKWLTRAKQSYRSGDIDDATAAVDGALKASPKDPETRLLAARLALAKLDFQEALRLSEGIATSDAKSIRGRAFWYAGDIERAADELDEMLKDPSIKDNWARDVSKLAHRGQGRHPFAIEGGVVAAVEMPQAGPALVVPCELEGERILALVATNFGELMIDSSSRKEPAWVNLRFGERIEVKDVPALTHDLSNISRQLGAPIKALLGVNLLRRMHVTFDRRASQFVVRKADPPAPPDASRLPLFYARGGAMLMRAAVSNKDDGNALLFVDSSVFYPLALEDAILKRSGADLNSFSSAPGAPQNWKMGLLPHFKLGTLDLPQVPAMQGPNISDYRQSFDVDLGGVVGAGLLSAFRVTFGDDGKWLWLELDPSVMVEGGAGGAGPAGPPGPTGPGAAPAGPEAPPVGPPAPKSEPPKVGPPAPKSEPSKGQVPSAKGDLPKTESKGAAK